MTELTETRYIPALRKLFNAFDFYTGKSHRGNPFECEEINNSHVVGYSLTDQEECRLDKNDWTFRKVKKC